MQIHQQILYAFDNDNLQSALLTDCKWEYYDNLILVHLAKNEFDHSKEFLDNCRQFLCDLLTSSKFINRYTHVALKLEVKTDIIRSPNVIPLLGDFIDFYATTKENGIQYCWNPLKTMYSKGNITEKLRVANFTNVQDKVVVDLYAGIGYFVFPYIKHAKAKLVHAIDMNPYSICGLIKGMRLNKIQGILYESPSSVPVDLPVTTKHKGHIIVYQGNNEDYISHYENQADHVNLGLLPTSDQGWPLAIRALKNQGGFLHIHANLKENNLDSWCSNMLMKLNELVKELKPLVNWELEIVNVTNVKSYAPRVYHYVIDVSAKSRDQSQGEVS